jgi:isocitrate lyase
MFALAREYARHGMPAYSRLQEGEFTLAGEEGYTAVRHQRFVGTGYFDEVHKIIGGGEVSTAALEGSTEQQQFSQLRRG